MEWRRHGQPPLDVLIIADFLSPEGETCYAIKTHDGARYWVSMREIWKDSPAVLQVRRLRSDAVMPQRMTPLASGLDLCAAIDRPIQLHPGAWAPVGTGIAVAIKPGYEGQIRPRSGHARRAGLTVLNAPGTIDADYRGEVTVLLVNHGPNPVIVEHGNRIAQLVICPVSLASPIEVTELPATSRGSGGFGSTGLSGSAESGGSGGEGQGG